MTLTILNVAYPLAPVGPDAVGGAEQILAQLDQALTRVGHHSLVIACEGSKVAGTLIPVPASRGALTESARQQAHEQHRRAIQKTLDHCHVDVIHMHGVDFYHYLPPDGVPMLVTLHLPPSWYSPEIFRLERPKTWLHCVSAAQRRACPSSPLLLPEIENGVDVAAFESRHTKRRFAIALGRVCPEKGFHLALDAATRAALPLLLGGEVFRYNAHERYYCEEIVPRLNGQHRFLGPLGLKRKRRLLGAARCLLAPSLAAETSSLAAMEALASGTPVIAFPSGALGGIVEHGRTGFLVNNEQEMAQAIPAAEELSAEVCRETAHRRFSVQRMIERYLELYRKLATSQESEVSSSIQPRS